MDVVVRYLGGIPVLALDQYGFLIAPQHEVDAAIVALATRARSAVFDVEAEVTVVVREELMSGAIKLVFMLIVFFVGVTFIRGQLEKLQTSLVPVRTERVATPRPATQSSRPASTRPPATAASRSPNGIQRMSDEELAEWERKNRESMEILERTTPELQH